MIGLFDSGSGGLSVLKSLREELPKADVLYFGDIKNAPYGEKSQAELSRLTYDALMLLRERGATNIVSACNSVSASLAISLFDSLAPNQNIIEMVGPAVGALRDEERRIAICATQATIDSQMYQNGLRMIGKQQVVSIPIPDLAGQIEFEATSDEMQKTIELAVSPHKDTFDICALACTHYPLVREIFEEILGNSIEIFDPAKAVAKRAKKIFGAEEIGEGKTTFIISKNSEQFVSYVATFFPDSDYEIESIELT